MRSSVTKLFIALFVVSTAWACSPTRTATNAANDAQEEAPQLVDHSVEESEPSVRGILETYVNAIGGADKLRMVNTLTTTMQGNVQGTAIEQVFYQSGGDKFSSQTTMMGMTVADQRYNNGRAKMIQQGMPMPLNDEQVAGMAQQAAFFPELAALENLEGYSFEGERNLSGEATYVLKHSNAGMTATEYYSQESGLKIRTVLDPSSGPKQTIDFSDYQSVNGIMFPHQMDLTGVAPFPISMNVNSIRVNEAIDEDLFYVD